MQSCLEIANRPLLPVTLTVCGELVHATTLPELVNPAHGRAPAALVVNTDGETPDEAIKEGVDALKSNLETLQELGRPIPAGSMTTSKKVLSLYPNG